MLRIGISSCFFYPDTTRKSYPHKTLQYMEKDLVTFLSAKGIMPILFPDVSAELANHFMNDLDGLVLHGGVDMSPTSYGETPIDPEQWPGDSVRDAYELMLIKAAFKRKIPILGICRGLQVLNVFFGGTLYQDLLTQKHNSRHHRHQELFEHFSHDVTFMKGGYLHRFYHQKTPHHINTVHHQGIKDLGKNLFVEAICPEDGQIEAISYSDPSRFVLGLQWHPEYSASLGKKVICPLPLKRVFFKACRNYQLQKLKQEKQKQKQIQKK